MHYRVLSLRQILKPCGTSRGCGRERRRRAEEIRFRAATDTEIKIGNIMPYSGPLSAYATIGKTEAAYFKKVNEEGGINGRQAEFHFLR